MHIESGRIPVTASYRDDIAAMPRAIGEVTRILGALRRVFRRILIFLPDKPQRLMRSPQHMPLLESHGKQPVHRS